MGWAKCCSRPTQLENRCASLMTILRQTVSIIRLYAGWNCLLHLLQYSMTYCSLPEVTSDVISGVAVRWLVWMSVWYMVIIGHAVLDRCDPLTL